MRLKGPYRQFQFLYGIILTFITPIRKFGASLISIPIWNYFNLKKTSLLWGHQFISIPIWNYFNLKIEDVHTGSLVVISIPIWNYFNADYGFPPEWRQGFPISIPIWNYFNTATNTNTACSTSISIPIWNYFNPVHYLIVTQYIT